MMMNIAQTQPGLAADASVAESTPAAAASSPPASQSGGGTDTIAPGQAALAAFAYSRNATNGRTVPADPQIADPALARRFGPAIALIRAALPAPLQAQFTAQLISAGDESPQAGPGAGKSRPSRGASLTAAELGKLIAGSEPDAAASAFVSRLAQNVARFGSLAVAQTLGLTHDRIAFAMNGGPMAAPFDDPRPNRRESQRDRPRDDTKREWQQRSDAAPLDEDPGFTIDDVVTYGGQTVARHRTASPLSLHDEKAR